MKKMILTAILSIVLGYTAAFATATSTIQTRRISNVESTIYNYAKNAKFYNDPCIYLDIKIGGDKTQFTMYEKCTIGGTIYLIGKSDKNDIKAIAINKDSINLIANGGKRSVQIKNVRISNLLIEELDQITDIAHL